MLKIENVVLPSPQQWEAVIRGMRNPMNSWDKSDSYTTWVEDAETKETAPYEFFVGDDDLALMKKLDAAGTDHRKFMRMIPVFLDITAPLYWWKEFDTYKIGTVANSCSTMHKIQADEITKETFSFDEDLMDEEIILSSYIDAETGEENVSHTHFGIQVERTVEICECLRKMYNKHIEKGDQQKAKKVWRMLIQFLPSSYNQKRTILLSYEVLANIYKSRRHHKLDEWHVVCDWIETLPYSELITGEKKKSESDEVKEKSLSYIYRQLKKAKIALARAEEKQNADEIADLKIKIEALDWLSEIALKENN